MATATISKAPIPATMNDDEFVAFVEKRPHGERWQLIEGDVVMMNPPRLRHRRVAGNLATRLNVHFEASGANLFAFQEVGLMVPGVPRFRPTADVAVIENTVDPAVIWADRFLLAGEVVSESNTTKQIERKRTRYIQHPGNLYVLVIAQKEVSIEIWSRRSGWEPYALTKLDDTLELPEFGFATTLRAIYVGTGIDM